MKWQTGLVILVVGIWLGVKQVNELSLLEWANISFLFGLLFILIGASVMILKTGFLTPVLKGFKLIGNRIAQKSRAMQQVDEQLNQDEDLQTFKATIAHYIMQITLIIGITTIIISITATIMETY